MIRNELLFIEDILNSIKNIEDFSRGLTKEEFIKDKLRQSAIIRQIEIIGEAVKNISDKTKKKYPNIEWRKIAGSRDILSHAYLGISMERVWNIIEKDLPKLKKEIEKIKIDED